MYVCHKLHFYRHGSVALANRAAPSFGIEREVLCRKTSQLRGLLGGKKIANVVVGLEVGHGIRPRRFAHWVLIDHFNAAQTLPISCEGVVGSRSPAVIAQQFLQGRNQNAANQGGFARTAYPADHGQPFQRNTHADVFEVLGTRSLKLNPIARIDAQRGPLYFFAPRQVVAR